MSFLIKLFKSRIKTATITICGLDKAGKTTFINYLMTGEFTATSPTLGVNREVLDLPKLNVNVLDLGGQEDFRGLWPEINERTDGLIYVVDSTDIVRLEQTKEIFYNIINSQLNTEIPILIVLNKKDLPNGLSRAEFMQEFDLGSLNYQWECYETSCKTGYGVYQSFKWFIDNIGGES